MYRYSVLGVAMLLMCGLVNMVTDAQSELQAAPRHAYDPRKHKKIVKPKSGEAILQKGLQKMNGGRILELGKNNWDKIVLDKNKHVLVWFTSPWSGHCKRFAPVYTALAKAHASKTDFVFAKLNAYENMDLAREHGIKAFPTVKWFPKQLKEQNADDKYNVALSDHKGELYHGQMTVKV